MAATGNIFLFPDYFEKLKPGIKNSQWIFCNRDILRK